MRLPLPPPYPWVPGRRYMAHCSHLHNIAPNEDIRQYLDHQLVRSIGRASRLSTPYFVLLYTILVLLVRSLSLEFADSTLLVVSALVRAILRLALTRLVSTSAVRV